MAVSISGKPTAAVPNPGPTEGRIYVNDAGKLAVRLSDGTDLLVQLPDGGPVFLDSQGTDPAAQANKYRVYSKVANGAANLHVRAPDGTVIQLTADGGLKGTGGGAFFDTVVDQVEETFSVVLDGGNSFDWDTGLHFVLPTTTDWWLVPVWVEFMVVGDNTNEIASCGALYCYVFEPGVGTPQSRIYPIYPGYVEGIPAQTFYAYAYAGVEVYYNTVVNGDEPRVNVDSSFGFGPAEAVTVNATAVMANAILIPDPSGMPF